jgi:hypothetical protein
MLQQEQATQLEEMKNNTNYFGRKSERKTSTCKT